MFPYFEFDENNVESETGKINIIAFLNKIF